MQLLSQVRCNIFHLQSPPIVRAWILKSWTCTRTASLSSTAWPSGSRTGRKTTGGRPTSSRSRTRRTWRRLTPSFGTAGLISSGPMSGATRGSTAMKWRIGWPMPELYLSSWIISHFWLMYAACTLKSAELLTYSIVSLFAIKWLDPKNGCEFSNMKSRWEAKVFIHQFCFQILFFIFQKSAVILFSRFLYTIPTSRCWKKKLVHVICDSFMLIWWNVKMKFLSFFYIFFRLFEMHGNEEKLED